MKITRYTVLYKLTTKGHSYVRFIHVESRVFGNSWIVRILRFIPTSSGPGKHSLSRELLITNSPDFIGSSKQFRVHKVHFQLTNA